MKKLLLTGSSSFLGWNLCKRAMDQYEIEGTVFKHSSNTEFVNEQFEKSQ